MTANLTSDELQAAALALAKLSLERPGWHHYLTDIAVKFGAVALYDEFRRIHQEPTHAPDPAAGTDTAVPAADLAADRALVAAWRQMHARTPCGPWRFDVDRGMVVDGTQRIVLSTIYSYVGEFTAAAHESPLADRLALRLDEVGDLQRAVTFLSR